VDDEKAILNPMEDLLESLGYRAISAESGMEALDKYKSLEPDVQSCLIEICRRWME